MASRTRNRVDGVQKHIVRRKYHHFSVKATTQQRPVQKKGADSDKDAVTHVRRYAKYVRPTTPSDNFSGYSRSPLSNSSLNSATVAHRSQLFTTRLLSFTGLNYISSRLLSFTISQRLSHDGRSLRRSLTYICTVQLSQVISCKSLTDPSTHDTYAQARAQYTRPAGETRPHQLCSVVCPFVSTTRLYSCTA